MTVVSWFYSQSYDDILCVLIKKIFLVFLDARNTFEFNQQSSMVFCNFLHYIFFIDLLLSYKLLQYTIHQALVFQHQRLQGHGDWRSSSEQAELCQGEGSRQTSQSHELLLSCFR